MNIFGKQYTRNELRKRIGNPDQIAGIRLVELDEGTQRPMRAALFHTGSGLEFTVLLDRCLDIAAASHNGRAMGWRSKIGDVAPQYYEAEGTRWLRSFQGGLLTTCGLTHVGAPAEDSALNGQGLHGRISNTPASDIKVNREWQGNDYVLSVTGTMQEASVFGENLTLTRTVWTKLGENRFWVDDVITNEGFDKTSVSILYHCNIGWPVVDEGSTLIAPTRRIAPHTAHAEDGKKQYANFDAPTHGYNEKVYFHDMTPARNGSVTAAIVNDGFKSGNGFGAYITYNKNQLPRFTQWKQMGEQDYTVGLEPSNCGVEGPAMDKKHGLLEYLNPGKQKKCSLEFGAITNIKEVKALQSKAAKVKPVWASSYLDFVQKS